ncbi:DNA (cytosine-5-)-methyltransferase [Mesorhizobium sp. M2D.F.Ca.ET.171.01.1.1]|uniref:DNA cytosine methyltransferase n=1 Tax=unclassified Mesorhizobium TaxID=325217 RepID=UPI0010923075|nr:MULTISPECIES: DNA (cytosine-5-)-methyltransferase [unclassified Mesorhizobium]TGS92697.1 DNA (cytosine-5-)-methyltransferase [Mesorhizobium sp. M2D.F.Ca.ET.178.01.1.1]TGT08502.1 DNA (cytosine-5-)-methyltransferase [Mesorhizobium sp. M2D.F.Ca.ET.171.01.1.1]
MYLKSTIDGQAGAANYDTKIACVSREPGISQLAVVGLFAGIGGLEQGFHRHGHQSVLLCEADGRAREVLALRFPKVRLSEDVRDLNVLPKCDVLTAGFPCQDLSQVGRRQGISGPNSGLIDVVLDLLANAWPGPTWLVLENVPFMLSLDSGRAIERIVTALERMGFAWAYRTVDARAFGLPQRRRRVVILASRVADPRPALLGVDAIAPDPGKRGAHACGFYWTEGNTGLGWAIDATPPLKGGSALHIPSPPAIWFPRRRLIGVPSIEDAERLQGFDAGWTHIPGEDARQARQRWRLIGNAVSVPFAGWVAERLMASGAYDGHGDYELGKGTRWPSAAWGVEGRRGHSSVSEWPVVKTQQHLATFLTRPVKPLSLKAAAGFLARLERSSLRYEEAFRLDLRHHIEEHDASNAQ